MGAPPGNNHNPWGRPVGSKNFLTHERDRAYEEAKARGYPHPGLRMLEIAYDETQPIERRDMMLIEASRIFCPKPKSVRSVDAEVPSLSSIEDAENFLAALAVKFGQELEPLELAGIIKHWIESKRAGTELELKQIAQGAGTEQVIRIENSLQPLPGTDVIMPPIDSREIEAVTLTNGHAIDGHALAAPAPAPAATEPPENDSCRANSR